MLGPWKVGRATGSRIQTVWVIFGVETEPFLRARPDGWTKKMSRVLRTCDLSEHTDYKKQDQNSMSCNPRN